MSSEPDAPTSTLLRLHADDTVACLTRSLPAGSAVTDGETEWRLTENLDLGHKIALVPIAAGEKVIKFGLAIGSASQDIRPGEHVHLHNLQSDYLPTYTLTEGNQYAR